MKTKTKIIFGVVGLVIILLIVLVSISLFGSIENSRTDGIEDYKLTKEEIADSKKVFEELDELKKFDMYANNKTIKVDVILEKEVSSDNIKKLSNEMLGKISGKNKLFYDVEIFIDTKEESESYPLIGHKHKSSEEFVW